MQSLPDLGSDFAGYRLEQLIARGGMGVVYSATHLRLSRRVALKLLAPELAEDADFRERFLNEARLAAGLEHPHVVPVYDAGEEEGVLFLAMRYLGGGDLRQLLQSQGRLSLERTLTIVEQVAGALDAAHELGLVHRDVKPANILFSERREIAYLSDFGVAKRQSSKGLTRTGSFLGSVDYCAPEQIESAVVDGRADVYALGGVLYHCLTGQPPYVRETEVAVLTAHLRDPPPALSRVRPDLPPALDGVLVTAMAKYPQVRYATAGAFAQALRQALAEPRAQVTVLDTAAPTLQETAPSLPAELETAALPPPAPTLTAPSPRRRRRLLLASLAGALLLVGGAGAAMLVLRGSNGDGTPAAATVASSGLAEQVAPRVKMLADRQQAINDRLPSGEQVARSSTGLGGSANDLATAIVRTQGFLAGTPSESPRDPATRKALSAALSAHLAYARALSRYAERPQDRSRAETTIARAADVERAYRELARVAPTVPRVPVKRALHTRLLTVVPPPPPKVVRFASVDRLQHCEARSTVVRCGSGPSGEVVQLKVGGPAVYLGRLGSIDRGGPALALGASIETPGGAIRCDSSYRGITCTDRASRATFVIGDYRHILSNPGASSGTSSGEGPVGVPSVYTGFFTSVDRLQHCYATKSYVRCGSGPSGQVVELRAGVGATYFGVTGSRDSGGPSMPQGTSFRTPAGTIECGSSSRGITCIDLAGSGESFTIGDHYVNVNGVVTRR